MLLLDRVHEGVVLLTLNRPESLNAITMELQAELDALLSELEDDGETRCLVLTGAGERAFSAGYDLHELAEWDADELDANLLRRERWIGHFAETPLPVIAALNGVALGAGAILATAADIRYGAPTAELRFTAAAYNGANATWSLPRLVGHGMAAELLLSSRPVDAQEARAIGLLNAVHDDVVTAACDLAAQIAANPPGGTRAVKRLLREHPGRTPAAAFAAENEIMRTELRPQPVRLPTLQPK